VQLRQLPPSLVRAALFVAWVPIVALAPILVVVAHKVMPTALQNFLFSWPQAALPYNTFHGAPPQVGARIWPGLWLLYWLAIAAAFAFVTRRFRPLRAFLLAGLVIVVFMFGLHVLIGAAGLYFELDGP